MTTPKKTIACVTLSMKEVAKLTTIFGVLAGALAWVHAEVTIPTVLSKAEVQIRGAIDRHAEAIHQGSLSEREFRIWAEIRQKSTDDVAKQILHRLDSIEADVRGLAAQKKR